jgi:hypothetical protein
MGCGASKGTEKKSDDKVEFKQCGVTSMDDFFQKCRDLIDQFKETTTPLSDAKEEFFEETGFYEVPGSSNSFSFLSNYYL